MAKFTDIFEDVTKQGTKIPTNLYLETGMYPIIDQGQSQVSGYTNETEGLFTDIPAIIFGDHTRIIKYVDTPCFLGADGVKLLKAKDPTANYKYLYYALCCADIPNTGYNRHFKWLKEVDIPEYSKEKQNKIVAQLEKIDNLISLRKQQFSKLDELVKSRFIELFENTNHPRVALIDLIEEGAGLSYGIVQPGDDGTGDMGVLRPVDMVDGRISTASIKYINRSIGDGFRKTELTGDELLITVRGTTGITALTDSRFRGMNVTRGIAVIRYDRNKIDPVYLNAYLNTQESQRYIQEHTRGATLQQINLSDLRIQEIMLPPMDQQRQLAAFVEQTDKSKLEIQKSLEKLETLKKALMQKYFG